MRSHKRPRTPLFRWTLSYEKVVVVSLKKKLNTAIYILLIMLGGFMGAILWWANRPFIIPNSPAIRITLTRFVSHLIAPRLLSSAPHCPSVAVYGTSLPLGCCLRHLTQPV